MNRWLRSSGPSRQRGKARIYARLRWGGRSDTELTVPFRTAATLSGRLVDGDGAGLAGRTLRDHRSPLARCSRPAAGRFAPDWIAWRLSAAAAGWHLAPDRRCIRRRLAPRCRERSPLTLRVRSGVELKSRRRRLDTGEVAHFSGSVRSLGAPLPRRGKLVSIQYFESAARRWRPVLVTRTDHAGRFHAGYRFRYISGSAADQGPRGRAPRGALALRAGHLTAACPSRNRVG